MASSNKQETDNIGRYQKGGITTIIQEQLASFVTESSVDHTGP